MTSPTSQQFDAEFDAQLSVTPMSSSTIYRLDGPVVEGFKRGSKLLGCPTANLSPTSFEGKIDALAQGGVYCGFVRINHDKTIHSCVLSIGTNPSFRDSIHRTVEVHVLHDFEHDFYGQNMRLLICGYMRGQHAFSDMKELIRWIQRDGRVSKDRLAHDDRLNKYKSDEWLIKS